MASRLSRGLLLASLVAATFTMGTHAVFAADPAIMSVSPATASANAGDDVSLDIDAANVPAQPGLGGYLIVLQWNPAVLTLTSLADAGWVTGGDIVVLCDTPPTIDNTSGNAELACSPALAFGGGVSTTAPKALAHTVFHAKASGTTTIDLSGSSLLNPSNIAISSTLTNGSVTVAPATATPSPAATSTAQPTSTATVVSATDTPVSTPTPAPVSQAPSTKPTQETLSKVDVPQTGSGTPDGSGTTWGIPALTAAGAALLGIGGLAAFRRRRSRQDRKE